MKVLLVRPKFPSPDLRLYPPYGLVALAPYFRKDDVHVYIKDLAAGQVLDILDLEADVIAFTALSSQLKEANEQMRKLRLAGFKGKLVVGGAGVTSNLPFADNILTEADTLVSGDGEQFASSISEYFPILGKQRHFYSTRFDFLDDHMFPMWHLIDYKRYAKSTGLAVETSRGCPFDCVWCTAHVVCGKKWRPRSPHRVVNEIEYVRKEYGCKIVYFPDDNCTVDIVRFNDILDLLVEENLDVEIRIPEGIQAHRLNLEIIKNMKRAGVKLITIGAESGVQRVLDDIIHKGGLKVEQTEQVVRDCVSVGLDVNCFFVIGTVGETLDEAKQTVDFAQKLRKLGAYSCMVRNAIPIVGTRMFEIAKAEGALVVPEEKLKDLDFVHGEKHLLKTKDWNPEQIEELVRVAKAQDARHILYDKKGRLLKNVLKRSITEPRTGLRRARQLLHETRK